MTSRSHSSGVTARLRAQAATLPAGEAIGAEDAPEAAPSAEHRAAAAPERAAEPHQELGPPREPRGTPNTAVSALDRDGALRTRDAIALRSNRGRCADASGWVGACRFFLSVGALRVRRSASFH